MTKQEARNFLKGLKGLKGYEVVKIDSVTEKSITFNAVKGKKCYYGFYDFTETEKDYMLQLDYAGLISEFE